MAYDGTPITVRAIYPFKGTNNDELNFKKGDIITVTQIPDGGWWEGTLDDVTGWFPSNYVKEYKIETLMNSDRKTIQINKPNDINTRRETIRVYRNVVLKDIIDSEVVHLNELLSLQKSYLVPLQSSEVLTTDEFRLLVGNLDEVIDIQRKLLINLEDCNEISAEQQRIGGAFIHLAPHIKAIHLNYCANHPKAVAVIEKHREELNLFMESYGAPSPSIRVLTTGLSRPFRRLEKYRGLLLEVERHIEESHVDRGDTQRAVHVYKDIAEACSKMRRKKEMELEVLRGNIIGWEGEDVLNLGEIVFMSQVTILSDLHEKRERHLVLFSSTLVFLSVSSMSTFVYEGKLPLTGIDVLRLEDSDTRKHALEISGKMIDTIVVACLSEEEQRVWVEKLTQQIRVSWTFVAGSTPKPPTVAMQGVPPSPLRTSSSAEVQGETVKVPYRNATPTWTYSCLRPAPPLRPSMASSNSKDDSLSSSRRISSRFLKKKDDRSFVDDAQILRVIEAYCTSAKTRYTVNSVDVASHSSSDRTMYGHCFRDETGESDESKLQSAFLVNPQVLIAEEEKIINEVTSGDQTIVEEKSLVDTVYALKDQMKELQQETKTLAKCLEEEQRRRKQLEDIIRKHVLPGRDDIKWDE